MSRINREEKRLLLQLLDHEIYDLCGRLDPEKEFYEGRRAEDVLKIAVSAREKVVKGLPENISPLSSLIRDLSPRFGSMILAKKFRPADLVSAGARSVGQEAREQQTEFLYTWEKDHDNDADPGRWYAHPLLKRTNVFVFVSFGYSPRNRRTMKLRRQKLEEKGSFTWFGSYGHHEFFTEESKKRIDERRAIRAKA